VGADEARFGVLVAHIEGDVEIALVISENSVVLREVLGNQLGLKKCGEKVGVGEGDLNFGGFTLDQSLVLVMFGVLDVAA
jgi:hypothetical protein